MSRLSLRSAIDAKCRDCGGLEGGRHSWRQHTSVCPVTTCSLWPVRPLASRNVPKWLAARDQGYLPADFHSLTCKEALGVIREAGAVMHPETASNREN